jgi:phage gp29-like protein
LNNGKVIYKSLKTRPPHSFQFDVDDKGFIKQVIQSTPRGELKFEPKTFLHHVYQMEFGNPYGKSDLQSAYAAWKAKKFFSRFFAIYVEKYASPPLVGKYPKTYSTSEREEFFNKIKTLQNATTFTIPDDVMLEFVQHSRDASDIYLKGLDYYNMQIARSILVPDLLGIGGTQTEGGSYALGREQFKLFLSTIKKDRESLERKITFKLIRPIVLSNFGDIDQTVCI